MTDQAPATERDPEEDSTLLGDLVGEPTEEGTDGPDGEGSDAPPTDAATEFDRHREAGQRRDQDIEKAP